MSQILLAGLTDHESAAIEIMVGMHWRDWSSISLKRSLSLTVPEQNPAARACRACVLDLFGFGMRRHAPEHEARLLDFLAGRSAVLLVWGNNGGGWLDTQLKLAPGQQLAWVTMPYTTSVMRDALKKVIAATEAAPPAASAGAPAGGLQGRVAALRAAVQAQAAPPAAPPLHAAAPSPAPAAAAELAVPAWRRAMAFADKLKAQPAAKAAPQPAPPAAAAVQAPPAAPPAPQVPGPAARLAQPQASAALPVPRSSGESLSLAPPTVPMSAQAVGMSQGALSAVLTVFPQLRTHPQIALVGRIMSHDGAVLLKAGNDAAFIAQARQGWLASSLPISALLKMLHTPHLLETITLTPLPAEHADEAVRQYFGGDLHRVQKPLDALLWELVLGVLKDMKLAPQADLSFQLQCFPNFTLLSDVGPLDVQLAAICSRMPQSLADLGRAFPKHEQDVYRFSVLTILTGLAVVTIQPADQAAQAMPAPVPRAPAVPQQQVAVRRGFFKSLLDKLF